MAIIQARPMPITPSPFIFVPKIIDTPITAMIIAIVVLWVTLSFKKTHASRAAMRGVSEIKNTALAIRVN